MVRQKAEASAEQLAAAELVRMAKEQGLSLTGRDGLLRQFTNGKSAAAETVSFGVYGGMYEIDLAEANAREFRAGRAAARERRLRRQHCRKEP